MRINKLELPNSWTVACLDDVTDISPSVSLEGFSDDQLVHFVPMAAVAENFACVDTSQLRPLSEVRKGYTAFVSGDVLLAKITPCMENGKGGLVPVLPNQIAFGSTEFHVLRASTAISNSWLAHYLAQPAFRSIAKANMTGTAGQMRVPTKWLRTVDIPVPPAAEQTRIVAKLEELLSDLDAGVAELKAAQRKLAQYRQSLLKAAVEGALTADWRQQHAPAESGAQLLERILAERRARWEAKQLAKFQEQGKTPPKDWQKKYPEPVKPETEGLPGLPEGWVWASVDQLSQFVRNGMSKTPNQNQIGYPILRINAVRPMAVYTEEVKHIELSEAEARDYFIEAGDLLATRYNGSVDLLGVFGLVKHTDGQTLHPDKLIRMTPVLGAPLGSWIEIAANTGCSRGYIVRRVKTTAGQTGISGEDLKKMPIPLPPILEQDALVAQVSAGLADTSDQALAVSLSLKQSAAQRKNILKAAFTGQLVPQDPNDEPASVLLERIRAERAAQAGSGKGRARKVKETA